MIHIVNTYCSSLLVDFVNVCRVWKWRKKNRIGKYCRISKDAILLGNVVLGNHVTIGANVVLGRNVRVGNNVVLRNIKIGDNSQLESNIVVTGSGNGSITIGKGCYFGFFIVLDFSDNITIGNNVHIGSSLWTHSSAKQCIHNIPLTDKNIKYRPVAPIIIEDNVYIGVNSTIYPGVTIKHHSVVAPNSVVNKDVEPNSLIGGVPAKFIKKTTEL